MFYNDFTLKKMPLLANSENKRQASPRFLSFIKTSYFLRRLLKLHLGLNMLLNFWGFLF